MAIRNLHFVKHSLMEKNVLNFVNAKDLIWVDILSKKYGKINFWTHLIPLNCSWLFRGLCITTEIIKPYLSINLINPSLTFLLQDPWIFEVPLAFKPISSHEYES